MAAPQSTWGNTSPPNYRYVGPFCFADRNSRDAKLNVEGRLRSLRMAHSLPDLHHPGAHQPLHPFKNERVADIRATEGRGHDISPTTQRRIHQVAKSETGFDFTLRSDRRAGRRLVHRTVLRSLLHANYSKDKCENCGHHRGRWAAAWHALLYRGGRAFRPPRA